MPPEVVGVLTDAKQTVPTGKDGAYKTIQTYPFSMRSDMNFLDLCQRLVRETGIADDGPATVTGQIGDFGRVVDWINDAG